MLKGLIILGLIMVLASLSLACGGDDSDDAGNGEARPAATGSADESPAEATSSEPAAEDEEASDGDATDNAGTGSATLTIGDESWTLDILSCGFSPEETVTDSLSFSATGSAEVEGERLFLDVSIEDLQEEGRYEGEGVIYAILFEDTTGAFSWVAHSGTEGIFGASGETIIEVDGKNVTAVAVFNDPNTDAFEDVPGSLDMTCP